MEKGSERITEQRHQGADRGDKRQAARCPFDPHERVHFQRQGDQQGREEQQAGAHYANVYSEMKPHPTRRAPGGSGSSAASAAVRSFNPRHAVPGRAAANRTTREDMVILPCALEPGRHTSMAPQLSCAIARMGDRCCHMPSQLGCALNATEVQSSRRNLNLVYTQVNENAFLIQTLRPIRRRDKYARLERPRFAAMAFTRVRSVNPAPGRRHRISAGPRQSQLLSMLRIGQGCGWMSSGRSSRRRPATGRTGIRRGSRGTGCRRW